MSNQAMQPQCVELTLDVLQKNPTDKSVFLFVAHKLLNQEFQSLSKNGSTCLYRGESDTKCAFGHLIPDDEFKPEMEKNGAENSIFDDFFAKYKYNRTLIKMLQCIHDRYWDDRENRLQQLNDLLGFGLWMPNVKEHTPKYWLV